MILEHRHLIIKAKISNPITEPQKAKTLLKEIISSVNMKLADGFEENAIVSTNNNFLKLRKCIANTFLKILGLSIEANPISYYCNLEGNKGLTAVAILETSHCAIHIWDEDEIATLQFDLYSCADFTIEQILPVISKMNIIEAEYKFINRDNGIDVFKSGIL